MKRDIILAGVGGQGIISIAAIIGTAALEQGLFLKQSEVHGMSQRVVMYNQTSVFQIMKLLLILFPLERLI